MKDDAYGYGKDVGKTILQETWSRYMVVKSAKNKPKSELRCIGKGKYYNGRTKVSYEYLIYG